jgi:hypothetical protein
MLEANGWRRLEQGFGEPVRRDHGAEGFALVAGIRA